MPISFSPALSLTARVLMLDSATDFALAHPQLWVMLLRHEHELLQTWFATPPIPVTAAHVGIPGCFSGPCFLVGKLWDFPGCILCSPQMCHHFIQSCFCPFSQESERVPFQIRLTSALILEWSQSRHENEVWAVAFIQHIIEKNVSGPLAFKSILTSS